MIIKIMVKRQSKNRIIKTHDQQIYGEAGSIC
jgi:hypothetical protein